MVNHQLNVGPSVITMVVMNHHGGVHPPSALNARRQPKRAGGVHPAGEMVVGVDGFHAVVDG